MQDDQHINCQAIAQNTWEELLKSAEKGLDSRQSLVVLPAF
jgi:hypothetical protein